MKISTLLISYVFLMFVGSTGVYAAPVSCSGMDPTNAKLDVIFDQAANTLVVNGQTYSMHAPAPGQDVGASLVSNSYDTNEYGMVYITLANKPGVPGRMIISQVTVKDHVVKSVVDLVCK